MIRALTICEGNVAIAQIARSLEKDHFSLMIMPTTRTTAANPNVMSA